MFSQVYFLSSGRECCKKESQPDSYLPTWGMERRDVAVLKTAAAAGVRVM